jgi:hypothetical protein
VGTLLALLDVRRLLELRGTELIGRPDESPFLERVCGRIDGPSPKKGDGLLDCEEDRDEVIVSERNLASEGGGWEEG